MSTIIPKEKMDEKPTGRSLTWECIAEFFGTLALLIFGDIALAHGMLNTMNFTTNICIAAGNIIGVVIGVAIVMKNSACHINPVVTIAFALWGRFPWKRVPGYIIAQYMAGIVGAGIVYLTFIGEMRQHEAQLSLPTAQIFTSFPGSEILVNRTIISHVTMLDGLSDQIWSTMILLVVICALIDGSSGKLPLKLMPFVVGVILFLFGVAYKLNIGLPIHPSRDLGHRIFIWAFGWGFIPFGATTADGYSWWWVPVIGAHIGAILGVLVSTLLTIILLSTITPKGKEETSTLSKT